MATFAKRPFLGLGLACVITVAMVQGEDPRVTRGRELFRHSFPTAEGLGAPEMNGDSCFACHRDPVLGGAGGLELNVSRFGADNGGQGPFTNLPGGQAASKLFPPNTHGREEYATAADCFEQRQSPTLLGAGLIDTIPETAILANEDPLDLDQNGILGVARRLTIQGGTEIGRFGWKAQIPRLADFVHDAMFNELGITTPDAGRGFSISSDNDAKADPELSTSQIDDLAAFLQALPAPQRRGSTDPRVAQGAQVFQTVGCAVCHRPELLGSNGPVPLFSDLLLHNVAAPGQRGMAEPGAPPGFYRTPPLWGIGSTAPYLHDGRAETLLAAILLHDGEAASVRTAFQARSADDREALLVFLGDL